MDTAEEDVLAYMSFPPQHRTKLHSTNPLERFNGEIKRRTDVVGIFPNEDAIIRLAGAILLEQNDERAIQRARYALESVSQLGGLISAIWRIGLVVPAATQKLSARLSSIKPSFSKMRPDAGLSVKKLALICCLPTSPTPYATTADAASVAIPRPQWSRAMK
jgi:hypothetical protein